MIRVHVEGIGLCAPGLENWAAGAPVLAGRRDYVPAEIRLPQVVLLPANERRRAVQTVRLALAVGAEAFAAAGRDPASTATIFASSGGDGETIHQILNTLASSSREISPTRFHNSVHNAPAGYWSIATGARAASTSLCCHDDSFAAGLLEAAVQTRSSGQSAALIVYDVQYPSPLGEVRPIGADFAVALVLAPVATETAFAVLEFDLQPGSSASTGLDRPALEALRQGIPAARSLPLLAALARNRAASLCLQYLDDMVVRMAVTPSRHGGTQGAGGEGEGAS